MILPQQLGKKYCSLVDGNTDQVRVLTRQHRARNLVQRSRMLPNNVCISMLLSEAIRRY
jgi:hypothetical protein